MTFQSLFKSQIVQILAIIALIVSVAVIGFYTTKKESMEHIEDLDFQGEEQEEGNKEHVEQVMPQETREFAPTPAQDNMGEISPQDLLPKSSDVKSFEHQFPQAQDNMDDKNFLVPGYNIGINTVSSSLKNANQQLRSDPHIPRVDTGPWNQSTILSSDLTNRQPFEIGTTC
jgi:hypothetical protein